jgi:hypothetical protein
MSETHINLCAGLVGVSLDGLEIAVEVGKFKGRGYFYITQNEAELYVKQLSEMRKIFNGSCRIIVRETGEFYIEFKEGVLNVEGIVSDYSSELSFGVKADHTILIKLIRILKKSSLNNCAKNRLGGGSIISPPI